ncbi:MAG: hypothetical protein QXU65_00230 [Sulfolobales archaeon]
MKLDIDGDQSSKLTVAVHELVRSDSLLRYSGVKVRAEAVMSTGISHELVWRIPLFSLESTRSQSKSLELTFEYKCY